jgi:protein-disulfide isomerase
VQAKFNSEMTFQFRNLPLTSIHPNAFAAARAAEAAGLQNKYFEMHDKLYEGQSAWSSSTSPVKIFQDYAKALGLDMTKFNSDYSSSRVNTAINADLDAFKKTGKPQGTPSIFINGENIELARFTDPTTGAPNAEKISKVIQDKIDKAR